MANAESKKIAILGVLILILTIVLLNNLSSAKKKKMQEQSAKAQAIKTQSVTSAVGSSVSQAAKSASVVEQIQRQPERLKNLYWDKDPFYPRTSKITSRQGGLFLKGISFSDSGSSFAVINDEILQEGDKIGEWKIIKIQEKQVILEKNGQQFILALEE